MRNLRKKWMLCLLALVLAPTLVSAAVYTDDFNRADSYLSLGPDWNWVAHARVSLSVVGNQAEPDNPANERSTYYAAAIADNHAHVLMSVEFRACNQTENAGVPSSSVGINYVTTDGLADARTATDYILIQGTVGAKLWIDGGWRDTNPLSTALIVGDWYTATLEQDGADFTATISTAGGTIVQQNMYTSLVKSSSTGYAYIFSGSASGTRQSSIAFDNFSLEISDGTSPVIDTYTGEMIGINISGDEASNPQAWLNPEDSAGAVPQTHWNNSYVVDAAGGALTDMLDQAGLSTTADLAAIGSDGLSWGAETAIGTKDDNLLQAFIYSTSLINVEISQIPYALYDVIVYYDAVFGAPDNTMTFSILQGGAFHGATEKYNTIDTALVESDAAGTNDSNYVVLRNQTRSDITIRCVKGNNYVYIDGIQIVEGQVAPLRGTVLLVQ